MFKKKEILKKREVVKATCTCCNVTQTDRNFYQSKSFIYKATGRLSICKDCISDLYAILLSKTDSYRTSMYRLCRKLDLPFLHSVYDMAEREGSKRNVELYRMYFQKVNSLGAINNYSGDFDNSDDFEKKMDKNINDVVEIQKEIMEDFELTADMIIFWGEGLSLSEYKYLSDQYSSWKTRTDIESKSLEDLIKQVCFQDLLIKQKRISGESVDKDLKTWQDLLTSCNLKPSQDSALNSTDQATFGTLIKKWEMEKPISEPSPEWRDVDKVGKYIRAYFTGHLAEMFGLEANVSNEYREELDKYTVSGSDLDGE